MILQIIKYRKNIKYELLILTGVFGPVSVLQLRKKVDELFHVYAKVIEQGAIVEDLEGCGRQYSIG